MTARESYPLLASFASGSSGRSKELIVNRREAAAALNEIDFLTAAFQHAKNLHGNAMGAIADTGDLHSGLTPSEAIYELTRQRDALSARFTPARHDLPDQLRSLTCQSEELQGDLDHGHTSCYFVRMAADEIERMRLVLGDLTAAKSRAVSQRSHARHKKVRAQRLAMELREQNARLIAELLAYRAEEAS